MKEGIFVKKISVFLAYLEAIHFYRKINNFFIEHRRFLVAYLKL